VVQDKCQIGNRVIIQSGAVIGSDGHGYFQREGVNLKIPQLGIVQIEDDVEVGACTTIDRARFHTTVIKQGSKLDNQVQIAHNVSVGEQALISAQTAVGGSVKAGHHLILGGQSGIRDNVQVGNNVTAVARAVITANTQDNEVLGGMPGRPVNQWRQLQSLINRLGELFDRVRKLESRTDSSKENN
jgi:UDP-3-O-[3-hydroxymyristoyl] glucosamine N-acyltransferase